MNENYNGIKSNNTKDKQGNIDCKNQTNVEKLEK